MQRTAAKKEDSKDQKSLQTYITSIDFSVATDPKTIENIYEEIGNSGFFLATNPYTTTALEKLVGCSTSKQLVKFINTLPSRILYTKLGSRILEQIYRRIFECLYVEGEDVLLGDAVRIIEPEKCIRSRDAVHVLREAILLFSGKQISKLEIKKIKVPVSVGDEIKEENRKVSLEQLEIYKNLFQSFLKKKEEGLTTYDAWITLQVLIQCTKSQSLLKAVVEYDCSPLAIKERGYFYEALPSIANKANLSSMYDKIKHGMMDLVLTDESSFFMRQFVLFYHKPWSIFQRFSFGEVEQNSRVVLALLEALVRAQRTDEVKKIISEFYSAADNLFYELLLSQYGTIDTKYVDIIVALMRLPKDNYGVNKDFVKHFQREWVRTKAGIKLVVGYINGCDETVHKQEFFNKNVDAFWRCRGWQEGKAFVRLLTKYTTGHARKKAFEMLQQIDTFSDLS